MSDHSHGHGHDHDHDGHGHNHDHGHGHGHDHGGSGNRRALKIALVINTAFFVVEIAGALYANSLTLFADAAHMLTDSASILLALFAAWIATLDADSKRTYGYQRAEILAALANGVFLVLIVVYVAYEAVMRFQNPQDVKALPTIVVGIVGLGANLAGAYVLHGGRDSLNVEGVYLHLLTDAAGSLAAIALGVGLYVSDLYVLDPIFSLVIAALVLYSAKDLLIESVNILLQGTPSASTWTTSPGRLPTSTGRSASTTCTSGRSPTAVWPVAPTSSSRTTRTATRFSMPHVTCSVNDTTSATPPFKSSPRAATARPPTSTVIRRTTAVTSPIEKNEAGTGTETRYSCVKLPQKIPETAEKTTNAVTPANKGVANHAETTRFVTPLS